MAATRSKSKKSATPKMAVELDPAQKRFMKDESRVQVVCWHRQKGKDFATAAKAVLDAMRTGQAWYIVSLTQRQADETFDKCVKWAKAFKVIIEAIESQTRTEYDHDLDEEFEFKARELRLPNGGRVVSLPGRNPDALAGFTGNVVFTEFGLFPGGGYDHWRVVFPLTTRGFKVIVISTPRSKNTKFYELVSDSETYSVHVCDIYQSIAEGYVLKDQNGEPCDVETFKRLYGDDSGWAREYECQFTGDLETLVKWGLLEAAGDLGRGEPFDLLRIEADAGWQPGFFRGLAESDHRAEIGWDVARRGHLSALWVNVRRSAGVKALRYLVLMHDATFALQREVVCAAMDARPGNVGCGDATGLGMESNETLTARYGERWEGVDFGGKRKSDIGSGLATAFNDAAQLIPPLDGPHKFIATDIYAIQRQVEGERIDAGKARLKLTENPNPLMDQSHCDIAYAGGLAIRAGHRATRPEARLTLL